MKPLLIFDGDCNFCRRWIYRWRCFTGEQVDYAPYQEVAAKFPQIPPERFKESVQLIESTGRISGGAEAVFRMLSYAPGKGWMLRLYEKFLPFRIASEWFYKLVARNRVLFSQWTWFFWGAHLEPPQYVGIRNIFLKLLGAIYFIAFVSFWSQMEGLIGENGILPAKKFLESIGNQGGFQKYWLVPTLGWLNSSDAFLHFLCGGGVFFSILVMLGFVQAPALFLLWVFYLSITTLGQDFLEFQWDILLLETGFLSIFFAPLTAFPRQGQTSPPSKMVLGLMRWLLFRLFFSSGVVKLTSGDPTWRNLTALNFHYETQPLPTWVGWYAHQLPSWFQKFSVAVMFGIELGIPFLIFFPRRLRLFACKVLMSLQLLIAATGNYCFFNLLTILLCLLLLDDTVFPERWREKWKIPKTQTLRCWPRGVIALLMVVILFISSIHLMSLFDRGIRRSSLIYPIYRFIQPFRTINSYGLFAVMTTQRPEIIVEGSNDGERWFAYEFRFKPGDLKRKPAFVAPHQPRLDWQMWFAALGDFRMNPWFVNFMVRLLKGSPEVLTLLEKNPFPESPPKYVRAVLYEYRFTNFTVRKALGTWWQREIKGPYAPILSLKNS